MYSINHLMADRLKVRCFRKNNKRDAYERTHNRKTYYKTMESD